MLLPGDADRVMQPVLIEHAEQFGRSAGEPDQAERGQHGVPQDQQSLEPEAGAVAHQPPEPEHQDGVRGRVVEPVGPVLDHPLPRRLVVEVLLEVEHVRVVGRFLVRHDADHGYRGADHETLGGERETGGGGKGTVDRRTTKQTQTKADGRGAKTRAGKVVGLPVYGAA